MRVKTLASSELGNTLKQRRLSLELTLRQLAAKSEVSVSHLARIERGERFPSGHVLRRIAGAMEIDESLLMSMAGYLSPQAPSETRDTVGLDTYVARVLAEEPVEVQRTVIAILAILRSIARAKG